MIRLLFLIAAVQGTIATLAQIPIKQHGPYSLYYAKDVIYGKNGRIFLSTSGGLYTADPGTPWKKTETSFNSIYMEPSFTKDKNGNIYLWDRYQGVHHSSDNGITWQDDFFYFSNLSNQCQAIQVYGDTLFVATPNGLGYVKMGVPEGVAIPGLQGKDVTQLKVNGNLVVAGTVDSMLYVSLNRGSSWTITSGLPFNFAQGTLELSGSKLFVGTMGTGVWYSDDLGQHWTQKNSGLSNLFVQDLYIDQGNLYSIVDRPYISTLDGSPWQSIAGNLPNAFQETCIAADQANLFVGGWEKLYQSSDVGVSWTPAPSRLLTTALIQYLVMDLDSTIWASGQNTGSFVKGKNDVEFAPFADGFGELLIEGNTIYSPTNNGGVIKVFDRTTRSYLSSFTFTNDVLFPKKVVHASNGFFVNTIGSGVWKYTPQNTWENYSAGLGSLNTYDFVLKDTLLYVATDDGLYWSGIHAALWKKFVIGSVYPDVNTFIVKDLTIITGSNKAENYRSDDGGVSWKKMDLQYVALTDIYLAQGIVYGCSINQLCFSNDLGKTWSVVNLNGNSNAGFMESIVAIRDSVLVGTLEGGILAVPIRHTQTITFLPLPNKVFGDPGVALNATASSGLPVVYASSDKLKATISGSNLILAGAGFVTIRVNQRGNDNFYPADEVYQSFCISPRKPVITVSPPDIQPPVLTSNAATGNQWYNYGVLIPGATENTLITSPPGLYSVTASADQCVSSISDEREVVITGDITDANSYLNLFPNPADEQLMLRAADFDTTGTQVSIIDLSGKSQEPIFEKTDNGLSIDISHYSSGIYSLRIQQQDHVHRLRFIKK
jgi:hypothetical protein